MDYAKLKIISVKLSRPPPVIRSALCIVEFSVQTVSPKISFPRERSQFFEKFAGKNKIKCRKKNK